MLDIGRIDHITQSYSSQELFAALVWQRQFNEFNGQTVITDLANHPDLWRSFVFTKPIFAPDKRGLSFCGIIDTLLAMANYCPMPDTSIIHFIPYPADTLYVLAENIDTIVTQLVDLGKKWRADAVDIVDGSTSDEEFHFQNYIKLRLEQGLWGNNYNDDKDAIVISYWWD